MEDLSSFLLCVLIGGVCWCDCGPFTARSTRTFARSSIGTQSMFPMVGPRESGIAPT